MSWKWCIFIEIHYCSFSSMSLIVNIFIWYVIVIWRYSCINNQESILDFFEIVIIHFQSGFHGVIKKSLLDCMSTNINDSKKLTHYSMRWNRVLQQRSVEQGNLYTYPYFLYIADDFSRYIILHSAWNSRNGVWNEVDWDKVSPPLTPRSALPRSVPLTAPYVCVLWSCVYDCVGSW